MCKKSKRHSAKKNNNKSKLEKGPSVTEDPSSQPLVETFLSISPLVTHVSKISSEAPMSINPINPDELIKISESMKFIIDKTFQNKSEMVVNRQVLEELVSQTLEDYCNQEENNKQFIEVNHLIEKYKALQAEEIELNRQHYSLTKYVEEAECIIKMMSENSQCFKKPRI